ncbi:MAG: polyamine aminopropyltransferase [Gammaproteobacteria bacterium]|nr:polyamine aminopropyltransferase [Gammaproteobacteria bacterium]
MAADNRLLADRWFTEIADEADCAFSLRIRGKVFEEQSPFQKVEVYETESWGNLMVIDGYVMLTTRDNFLYHEMMSHPVLFTHPDPRQVVIIGGGDCGTLREVLRHPDVEKVWQIDIDEVVTRAAKKFFPELCESNDDPRAELLWIDGLKWVREAAPESVDVVIVDSTDPVGPAEGLFGKKFYRDCLKMLRPGGILVQQSESPLLHGKLLREMRRAMIEAGFADTRTLGFPQPCYPSGWWSATMARKGQAIGGFRKAAAAILPFKTEYYTAEVHEAALHMPAFFKRDVE